MTVDPHLHRNTVLSDVYAIPAIAVHAASAIAKWIRDNVINPVLIGPDSESAQWVAAVAKDALAPFTVLKKRRLGDRRVRVSAFHMNSAERQTPVLVDDIATTANTMIQTVMQICAQGGAPPWCIAVHGLFTGNAYTALRRAGAGRIVTCNTIPHRSNAIDVTALLVAGMHRVVGRQALRKR